jgi:hypothetical protein
MKELKRVIAGPRNKKKWFALLWKQEKEGIKLSYRGRVEGLF